MTTVYGFLLRSLKKKSWSDEPPTVNNRIFDMYHGSTDEESQQRIISRFADTNSSLRCVVATVAFGMGVQVPDVRYVVNWGPPSDMLTYWQEVGRCARDGMPGKAIMYFPPRSINKQFIDGDMIKFCHEVCDRKECIRKIVLQHLFVKGMSQETLDNLHHESCCVVCDNQQSVEGESS